jgi:hypothetical protein
MWPGASTIRASFPHFTIIAARHFVVEIVKLLLPLHTALVLKGSFLTQGTDFPALHPAG